jgi:putative nucleotidyltransferase with HDIG domain
MSTETIEAKRTIAQKKLDEIRDLPSIPKIVIEVTELLKDESNTAVELSECIGKDQGLTTKILSIANSPFYGLSRQVSSLEFAIVVLGLREVSQLVTSISFAHALKQHDNEYLKFEELWAHSLLIGTSAKEICRHLGYLDISTDAFVAGMLHDIGIQILNKYFHREFVQIIQSANLSNERFVDHEVNILGITHQEMGCYLANKWNLPENLCDSIAYHHKPSAAEQNQKIVSVIHLTDYMCEKLNVAPIFWDKDIFLDESVIEILDFKSREDIEDFIEDYKEQFFDAEKYISVL